MVTINLRDFYPWYTHDKFVKISEAVAEEYIADKRYHVLSKKEMHELNEISKKIEM